LPRTDNERTDLPFIVDGADMGYFMRMENKTSQRAVVSQVNCATNTFVKEWPADDFFKVMERSYAFILHPSGALYIHETVGEHFKAGATGARAGMRYSYNLYRRDVQQ